MPISPADDPGASLLERQIVVSDLVVTEVDLLKIGMDCEPESVEVVDDIVCDEEMSGDILSFFDHVHELLYGGVVGLDGELGGGDGRIECGDGCDSGKTPDEPFAG